MRARRVASLPIAVRGAGLARHGCAREKGPNLVFTCLLLHIYLSSHPMTHAHPSRTALRAGPEAQQALRPILQDDFLKHYAVTGLIGKSAELAGTERTTIFSWRKADAEFDARCVLALKTYCEAVEAEIHRRAIEGVNEPVFYQGEVVGHVTRYSDRMLELHAKRHIPEYRERQQVDLNVKGGVIVVPGMALTTQQWEATEFDTETDSPTLPVPAP